MMPDKRAKTKRRQPSDTTLLHSPLNKNGAHLFLEISFIPRMTVTTLLLTYHNSPHNHQLKQKHDTAILHVSIRQGDEWGPGPLLCTWAESTS